MSESRQAILGQIRAALGRGPLGADAAAALQPKFLAIHESLRRDASARAADAIAMLLPSTR